MKKVQLIIVSSLVIFAGMLAVFFWRPEREPADHALAADTPAVTPPARASEQPAGHAPPAGGADAQPVAQSRRGDRDRLRGPRGGGRHLDERPLSDEEIRKNREAAEKQQEQRLAQAREDVDSKDEQVRLYALGYLDPDNAGDVRTMESLLLTDPSPGVREEAALQFGSVDKKIAEPTLIKALADPAPEVVVSAMEALTSMEGANKAKIIAAIKQTAASNADEFVRDAAQTALEELNQ